MKVAFLSFDFGEYSVRLASALAREAETCLLLPQELAEPHLAKLDPAVHFRPFQKPRLRQPVQQMQMLYTLWRELNRFQPDVVHFQQGHLWFNGLLPLLHRYPLVCTIHDPLHHIGDQGATNTPQAVYNFGFRQADQLIAHNLQMKEIACTALKLPAERIHVIPHVQLGEDNVAPTQTTEDENIILFFGRIWGYKGLDYLIRAEPLITSRVPNAKIMIAGEGEDFARYRAMMQHPENFIVYNEFIPDDQVAAIFQRASVVALPYIEATQSGVVPMAYSYSKPVVATTVGGLPAVVEQGQTGFLVPPRDEQALAAALVQLLQDKALCRQMGANGRHKVDMEFSAEIVAQKTLAVYRCAVAHPQNLNEMSASAKAKVKSSL